MLAHEDAYHAALALALSASGIKNLRVSTLDWYMGSPLNPLPGGWPRPCAVVLRPGTGHVLRVYPELRPILSDGSSAGLYIDGPRGPRRAPRYGRFWSARGSRKQR